MAHYDRAAKVKVEVEIAKLIIQRYVERRDEGIARGTVWNAASRNVISMSLDGDDIDKLYGALRYSQLVPIVFPRWRLRVYVSSAVLNDTSASGPRVLRILAKKLENSGVEVLRVRGLTATRVPSPLWAYLVADDVTVDRFIVRDSDTRPMDREVAALEDWLTANSSSAAFYCIRDHPLHTGRPLTPGLVGGRPTLLSNVTSVSFRRLMRGHQTVESFLRDSIWPIVRGKHVYQSVAKNNNGKIYSLGLGAKQHYYLCDLG